MFQPTLSRTCDLGKHKGHKRLGVIDGIEVWLCTQLQKVHLHGRRDKIRSILRVAEVAREVMPKVESESEAKKRRAHVFKNKIWEESDRRFGMRWDTVKWVMGWLVDAAKLGVGVNGLVHKLPSVDPYEAYVLLHDAAGDPPLIDTVFTCPTCSAQWDPVELPHSSIFGCTECCSWYTYTPDGDIERSEPGPDAAIVQGEATNIFGDAMAGVDVWLNKKWGKTDNSGRFLFNGVPPSEYKISIGDSFLRGPCRRVNVNPREVVLLGSIRLTPRVGRYVGPVLGILAGKTPVGRLVFGGAGFGVGEIADEIITNIANRM